jgi:magnesium chelatase family protein
MALGRAWSVALVGVEGHVVEVEADLAAGLPGLTIVGLPDTSLSESRDRVRAAVLNSGEAWPQRRITLGLSPATLPKRGSGFDVAMACSVLAAAGQVPVGALANTVVLGELGLDGRIRAVRGVLPAVLAAASTGFRRAVVPRENAAEAQLVPDVEVWPVASLRGLLARLRGIPVDEAEEELPAPSAEPGNSGNEARALDLADVVGQLEARRVMEVAAAGGHHVFLSGPPGTGKTMLAARLTGLLPALDPASALEVTAVHSVAGVLPGGSPLVTRPPFRDPHHTSSVAALVGGGSGVARPGAISLAHKGVLFLDEAPEFPTGVLDSLRQPLESGIVSIARSGGVARYPARFILVLAANPCPCSTASADPSDCTCSSPVKRRYQARLSGPLLDRVDLRVETRRVTRAELFAERMFVESSEVVAARVAEARDRAAHRLAGTPWRANCEVPGRELRQRFSPPRCALPPVEEALDNGTLSARGLDRVLRVAWTLADLAGVDQPRISEVREAISYRQGRTA